MKKLFGLCVICIALTGCNSTNPHQGITHEFLMENPLYQEKYAEEMVDMIVDMEIDNDAALLDEERKTLANKTKEEWLAIAKEARKAQRGNLLGKFKSIRASVAGEALIANNTLFLSPAFISDPGIDLHVYLSPKKNPTRDIFPNEEDVDLGTLITPYGTQRYALREIEELSGFHSIVLYDVTLKRIHGYAELTMNVQG